LGYRFIVRSAFGFFCLVARPRRRFDGKDEHEIAFYMAPRRRPPARQAMLKKAPKTIVCVPGTSLNRTIPPPDCDVMAKRNKASRASMSQLQP
jgi:hypothetical protein